MSITDPIADRKIRTGPKTLRELGQFSIQFYWFNRRLLKEIPGIGKRGEIIAAVNSWAGGLMLYRDFFRVNPYGGQDDDWLELDKKALAARAYKVNRSQIVGRVNLSSRNFRLAEQTNREGLVDNEYKQALVGILRHILISEFRTFITKVDKDRKVTDETTTDELDHRIEETTSGVKAKILEIRRKAPEHGSTLDELQQLTINLGRLVDRAKEMAKEYEDDRSKFVHLAGIGLMVEFVLHEIGRTTGRALDVLSRLDINMIGGEGSAALELLQDQLITLRKRVNTLDPLSTSRRQRKEKFELQDVIVQAVEGRNQQLVRHQIEVSLDLPARPYRMRAVKGMLIQILENLFENSVYWLKVQRRRQRHFQPQINISFDPKIKEITFEDNGPGVAASRSEEIFEPFVTSKPPGQGRGLGLYISRELARYHDWNLIVSRDGLNSNSRSSTFVLELEE